MHITMNNAQMSKYHRPICRYAIEPTIVYLVKIDGHTKFATMDYDLALAYVMNERAKFGWSNVDGYKRVKLTMNWKN